MTLYRLAISLHYIFSCWLRTVYLINLKNFICVDIVKCQVKGCQLLDFLQIILFLRNLASTGGPHEISRRAACGPWGVGQHWSTLYTLFNDFNCPAPSDHSTDLVKLVYHRMIRIYSLRLSNQMGGNLSCVLR